MSTILLVDQPDVPEPGDPFAHLKKENQRTYKVSEGLEKPATVRVRRDVDGPSGSHYLYVVENLVGGKWHRLLTGATDPHGYIPFDEAVARAAAVLL